MALAHNLGFPRIGCDPELKKAQQAFLTGALDEAGLRAVGRELRAKHWQLQKDAGIELLPVSDHALELTKWFDSNSHHLAPQLSADQQFALSWEQLLEEVNEAKALGHTVKPVVLGPLTYLWLGECQGADFDKLELLDRLLPLYDQILNQLAAQGVEWVQIDEPILALELPQAWKNAYERVYSILQRAPLKKLVATYFGGLNANLGLAANLPVDGLHIDLVQAPEQFPTILDRLPAYKVLSLGVVSGRSSVHWNLDDALHVLRLAAERLGERLWIAPSCPLLHSADAQDDAEHNNELALAADKCQQVALLTKALNESSITEARAA